MSKTAGSNRGDNLGEDTEGKYSAQRRRPTRRAAPRDEATEPALLSSAHQGIAAAYGNTLLFIGYEVDGLMEVVVYPRYRFSSDDRVQGHLGYVYAQQDTPWETLLSHVDAVFDTAQANYRRAVTLRASEQRAHGARYEAAYEAITDIFRESWHGFALRLGRDGVVEKDGVSFTGEREGPVLAEWKGEVYTLMVFPTGSITLAKGDRQAIFGRSG